MVSHLALLRDWHTSISSKNPTSQIKGTETILGIVVQSTISKVNLHSSQFPSLKKISDTKMQAI